MIARILDLIDDLLTHIFGAPPVAVGLLDEPIDPVTQAVYSSGERAAFPHCDSSVLHAPGECQYCDHYPDWQQARAVQGINFTGHHDPDKAPCPAERRRPVETINRWYGNVPRPHGD